MVSRPEALFLRQFDIDQNLMSSRPNDKGREWTDRKEKGSCFKMEFLCRNNYKIKRQDSLLKNLRLQGINSGVVNQTWDPPKRGALCDSEVTGL